MIRLYAMASLMLVALATAIWLWGNGSLFLALYHPLAIWEAITLLGDSLLATALVVAIVPRAQAGRMLNIALCIAITGLLAQLLKQTLFADWIRPVAFYPQLRLPDHLPSQNSFPSGHSVTAFTALVLMGLQLQHRSLWLWLLPLLWMLVALSRVCVGAHFPLDVLAGGLLGLVLTQPLYTLIGKRLNRWQQPRMGTGLQLLAIVLAIGRIIAELLG